MKSIEEIKNNIIADNIIKKFYNNKEFWDNISCRKNLSENFIEKYKDKLNFRYLDFSNISENFIIKNKQKFLVDFALCNLIKTNSNVNEYIINLFINNLNVNQWEAISLYQNNLSIKFLSKYVDNLNWSYISKYQNLSDELILNFNEYLDWDKISQRSDLTIEFLQKYSKNINFSTLFEYAKLNETFCEEIVQKCKSFLDYYAWYNLVKYQKLSNEFIDKYSKEISIYDVWPTVFRYQDYGKFMEA